MKFVIQRVNYADVKIDGEIVGSIRHGLLIFFGAGQQDTPDMLPKYVDKIIKMRIFQQLIICFVFQYVFMKSA